MSSLAKHLSRLIVLTVLICLVQMSQADAGSTQVLLTDFAEITSSSEEAKSPALLPLLGLSSAIKCENSTASRQIVIHVYITNNGAKAVHLANPLTTLRYQLYNEKGEDISIVGKGIAKENVAERKVAPFREISSPGMSKSATGEYIVVEPQATVEFVLEIGKVKSNAAVAVALPENIIDIPSGKYVLRLSHALSVQETPVKIRSVRSPKIPIIIQ